MNSELNLIGAPLAMLESRQNIGGIQEGVELPNIAAQRE
jgi:hypothetical protein